MKFTNFGKKLFAFIAVLTFGLVLVSCGGGTGNNEKEQHQANVQSVLDAIFFDETLLAEVKGDLTLVKTNGKYPDVTITWTSSETDVIAADGKVTRPALDDPRAVDGLVKVTLTVTATQGEATGNKSFEAYVLGEEKIDTSSALAIKKAFYQSMKDKDYKLNTGTTTKEIMVSAELTGNVIITLPGKGYYLTDGTTILYVYDSKTGSDSAVAKVGDTVHVTGNVYAYYGAVQFGDSVKAEVVESKTFPALSFEDSTIDAYTAKLDAAKDNGAILDVNAILSYNGYGYNLYAKLGKESGKTGTGDDYYLEDPYTGEVVALYYHSISAYTDTLDALVGKYVNIKVFTYDCYSSNNCYRVLYSGEAITEAAAPTLTDADKVTMALTNCVLDAKLTADLTLPVVEGVVWTLKETYGNAVIENGVLKVTRPENGEGNATVVVVATATFGAESDSKEISVEIVEKEDNGIKEVKEFDTEKTYKLGLYQGNSAKFLFATGAMNGFYGELVENAAAAADVKVIAVEGGYQLLVGTKYLELVQEYNEEQAKTFTNVKFVEEATEFVWAYNADNNTFTHDFEDATYYLGTYNTFTTLSASKLDKIGTSFPAHLYEVKADQDGGNDQPGTPVVGDGLVITAEALFVGCTGTGYAGYNGEHTLDGITYTTNQVMVAQGSSAVGVEGYLQTQKEKGLIANKNAYSKAIKTITLSYWSTYDDPYMPTIKAGATADALTAVASSLGTGVGTGVTNSKGYEFKVYTITYTLPEGCYFWEYTNVTGGAQYFSQIVLGF